MLRAKTCLNALISSEGSSVLVLTLIASNVLFNIVSNAGFKLSAASSNWRSFLSWQVVGNLAGLVTVLTLTWLLRYVSLHVAYSVVTGLAVVGVQVVAAALLFRETITLGQWLGTLLIALGILLIGVR